jgi:hypothetical protein
MAWKSTHAPTYRCAEFKRPFGVYKKSALVVRNNVSIAGAKRPPTSPTGKKESVKGDVHRIGPGANLFHFRLQNRKYFEFVQATKCQCYL